MCIIVTGASMRNALRPSRRPTKERVSLFAADVFGDGQLPARIQ